MSTARFGCLAEPLDQISGLLLGSIHKTHSDVLVQKTFDKVTRDGIETLSSVFEHTPTGVEYLITVTRKPESAE